MLMMQKGPIDLVHLEKYVVGDDALRDEILAIFDDQAAMLIAQFGEAQTDEGWRNTAHALKGASRGIGAWVLGDLCEDAETLIGKVPGKSEKRAVLLVSIRGQISEILAEAERVRNIGKCA
jgi:HPt (histidine-containing phosphotransfer) domain-containing protein